MALFSNCAQGILLFFLISLSPQVVGLLRFLVLMLKFARNILRDEGGDLYNKAILNYKAFYLLI